jgi:hypothetical protein
VILVEGWQHMSLAQRAREVAGQARSRVLSDAGACRLLEMLADVVEDLAAKVDELEHAAERSAP